MLKGKTIIITGAARGIGRSASLLFAREGANLILSDRDPDPLTAVVTEIRASGGEAHGHPGDVTEGGFAEELVARSVSEFGTSIDVLVNNAGYTWDALIHKLTDPQWEAMLAVHLTAPFRLIRAASPYMRDAAKSELERGETRCRKIINVSSIAGTDGNPGQLNYSTAKSGIVGMTKTLAKEWGHYNICVNAVAYGWIETRLTAPKEEGRTLDAGGEKVALGVPSSKLEMFRAMIPLGRPGTPEEAARVMLFLASPMSDYVSGQVIKVTGGM